MEITSEDRKNSEKLFDFIKESPSVFHVVDNISKILVENGFEELKEQDKWEIKWGKKYFVTRNSSSIVAFAIGQNVEDYHLQIVASHTDSPTFKLKEISQIKSENYISLNVEAYGGAIYSTWLDKPLTIGGRVFVKGDDGRIKSRLVYIDKDLLIIPNIPIHFNRKVNDGYAFNVQKDMCPLFSDGFQDFEELLAEQIGVKKEEILGKDLFLVNRQRQAFLGSKGEFISSAKLDNLQCAFASLQGFISSGNPQNINVYASFDNEEVGSNTMQGAMSTFLKDVFKRINISLNKEKEDYYRAVARSFLVSADNAHALHPNKPELYDMKNFAKMNGGIVIKESANQKYTTSGLSRAVFKDICHRAGVPVQSFANRSDIAGGSTLGNISNMQVSINGLDIGLAQLAMHSSYETGGVKDTTYMIKGIKEYFASNIRLDGAGD